MRISISTILYCTLAACSSIHTSASLPLEMHSAEDIRTNCSSYTNISGCSTISNKIITLHGVLYYPDPESYHPKLYPLGEKVLEYDLDKDVSIPEYFPLHISQRSRAYRRKLNKLHGRTIAVSGMAKTECAVANYQTGGGGIDEDGNIWMIGGYCNTQANAYLDNFEITVLEEKS